METQPFVNHGRWVAGCGDADCGGSQIVLPGQAMFLCGRCGQSSYLKWPDDVMGIGARLGERPVLETRNWLPSESLRDLDAENIAHGVGL
jgi:hypothetical protein